MTHLRLMVSGCGCVEVLEKQILFRDMQPLIFHTQYNILITITGTQLLEIACTQCADCDIRALYILYTYN